MDVAWERGIGVIKSSGKNNNGYYLLDICYMRCVSALCLQLYKFVESHSMSGMILRTLPHYLIFNS